MVECLYAADAGATVLSPTAIALQHKDVFEGWSTYANIENGTGYLKFVSKDSINHATINMYCEDRLWYHYAPTNIDAIVKPTVRELSTLSEFELWHHRLGHPNPTVSTTISNSSDLGNSKHEFQYLLFL